MSAADGPALHAALDYGGNWPIFPCNWDGAARKRPLTGRGFRDATTDEAQIREWWRRWPEALIGVPTGLATNVAVLDIDVKDDRANGYDALDNLGFAILPNTPMVHTGSGGLHLYFALPAGGLRNTSGQRGRGIGSGLDWRGDGGYVILPSPGSGYAWDPHWNFETVPLAKVPPAILPRECERPGAAEPVRGAIGLSPYAEGAIDSACRKILSAAPGEQEMTVNSECFALGTLAGAGAAPAEFARRALVWAARQIVSHDRGRPWRDGELVRKVERSFADGLRRPRATVHG